MPRQVTIHLLRHTFASALIIDGQKITGIADLLGHSSPAITPKVYAHWFKDVKTDAVGKPRSRVNGSSEKTR